MLPHSQPLLSRLVSSSTAAVASNTCSGRFGTTSTPPGSSPNAQVATEPGYLGYLSHTFTNIFSHLPWPSTSPPSEEKAVEKPPARIIKLKASRNEVTTRTKVIVQKLLLAESTSSTLLRIKELSDHLQEFPPTRLAAVQEPHLISLLVDLESTSAEATVRAEARMCLRLCGYNNPPRSRGINLLSIDGGGTRGMMGLEVLEALEMASGGKKIHEMFDHIVGVSTGAIIATMLGIKKMSASECRKVYMDISTKLFTQGKFSGATGLILNHSYYNTKKWIGMLKEILGEDSLASTSRKEGVPNVCIVSSIVNLPVLQPYIFRNYESGAGRDSAYRGGTSNFLWQAVQASAAAPGYFEEVVLGSVLHQDGGVIANNPTAIGVHEAKHVWPGEEVNCVVSVGNGRSVQELEPTPLFIATKAHHKLLKIIDSATDTEAVHVSMRDLLSEKVYYRLNPYMTHPYGLDEIQPARLDLMVTDAKLYVRRNLSKIEAAAERLTRPPTTIQVLKRSLQNLKDRNGLYVPR